MPDFTTNTYFNWISLGKGRGTMKTRQEILEVNSPIGGLIPFSGKGSAGGNIPKFAAKYNPNYFSKKNQWGLTAAEAKWASIASEENGLSVSRQNQYISELGQQLGIAEQNRYKDQLSRKSISLAETVPLLGSKKQAGKFNFSGFRKKRLILGESSSKDKLGS